ncbi:MAG TPA: hypothetical protein VHA74_01225, partial [Candidatus Dojkabacteria bacterium]|nr:hypothetical protein [Candidatus Dojkabacteria bacterium]
MKDYLKEAGNIHLSYYIAAADDLGIGYEIIFKHMTAKFTYQNMSWYINNTVVPVNSATSSRLTRDKKLANTILASQGIPVPAQLQVETVPEAITFFNEHNKSIVLKPLQNYGGKGVSILPKDENEVEQAFNDAQKHDKQGRVLAEEFIQGTNYRFLTLKNKVIGIVKRLPAYVIGNGQNSIKELALQANDAKINREIPLDDETERHLKEQGYTFDTIPNLNQQIFLRRNTNITTGGTSEECFDQVNDFYKEIAIKAVNALDLDLGGVDLIIE